MDVLQRNQQAFSAQSQGFSSAGDTYADEDDLAWMLRDLPLSPEVRALDIATGTGEFARALSPHVGSVLGLDATEAMLERGRRFVAAAGLENIGFRSGVVEELPFEDASFDVVASRYAFHHFADPKPVISEMARACRPGGHVLIVDIIVPAGVRSSMYNFYEWLCDPSHTRCLDEGEFDDYFGLLGLEVLSARERSREEKLLEWMDFSLTSPERRRQLLDGVEAELAGGVATGLTPHEVDSTLFFLQRDLSIVGRKPIEG